ncbi:MULTISPECIES: methylated-DNA--[protein]-cysteine S-methyltransferase [unclassified Apibacter]|nr:MULTISPECIES: methylated-DNA--[protein]-cysteine S-methyltransferase [Apibacter]
MSKEKQLINLTRLATPLGTMIACASEKGICLLEFSDRKMLERELQLISKRFNTSIVPSENSLFKQLKQQLDSYFEGTLKEFTVPLDWVGSDFQKEVWKVLLQIPYGKTSTYAIQAKRIGKPSSVRAVANANGMNMISILVPCHRVIGSDGSLTGYGGGLWRKKKLLELEAKGSLQLKLF